MENSIFSDTLKQGFACFGIEYSDEQINKFNELYNYMLDENTRQNLTRITEPAEAAEKHMVDSLTVLKYIDTHARVADIGCGAGFPTLPLAIMMSNTAFVAIDSTEKRIRYVNSVAEKLKLSNVSAMAGRAEELGKKDIFRENFDFVTGRAVAALNILSEYCLPLVKVGGKFIAMKANADEEISSSQNAIKVLGGKIIDIEKLKLPFSQSERTIIIIEKVKSTPANYPRAGGAISKKPL